MGTRETTALDLVQYARHSGGLDNVATILIELGELDGPTLGRIAASRRHAIPRRLGWLIERHRPDVKLDWLRIAARPGEGEPTPLEPSARKAGRLERNWWLRLNTLVEPDL